MSVTPRLPSLLEFTVEYHACRNLVDAAFGCDPA
jgi:hypothetical protein